LKFTFIFLENILIKIEENVQIMHILLFEHQCIILCN